MEKELEKDFEVTVKEKETVQLKEKKDKSGSFYKLKLKTDKGTIYVYAEKPDKLQKIEKGDIILVKETEVKEYEGHEYYDYCWLWEVKDLPESVEDKPKKNAEPESFKATRSIVLSYVKDLVCQGKVEMADWRKVADEFVDYINNGIPF